jgi:hypothetical protein
MHHEKMRLSLKYQILQFVWVLIALMTQAASTSETSVNFYQTTRRNIPEDSHFHTSRGEILKSHQVNG